MKIPYLYGFNPPFYGGPNAVLSRQEDEQLLKNDILQLLLTVPGERVFRPAFGTRLRTAVFDQLDNTTLNYLETDIRNAIARYEPRIILKTLRITPDNDNQNRVNIFLEASVVASPGTIITIDTAIAGL